MVHACRCSAQRTNQKSRCPHTNQRLHVTRLTTNQNHTTSQTLSCSLPPQATALPKGFQPASRSVTVAWLDVHEVYCLASSPNLALPWLDVHTVDCLGSSLSWPSGADPPLCACLRTIARSKPLWMCRSHSTNSICNLKQIAMTTSPTPFNKPRQCRLTCLSEQAPLQGLESCLQILGCRYRWTA
jgi:hypothetical protein